MLSNLLNFTISQTDSHATVFLKKRVCFTALLFCRILYFTLKKNEHLDAHILKIKVNLV
jgi:hypothetical protein